MRPEVRDAWADALESGEFKQGRGKLVWIHDGSESFCCLGVLCELAIQNGVDVTTRDHLMSHVDDKVRFYDGSDAYLPRSVREWAGVVSANPIVEDVSGDAQRLSALNDAAIPFRTIARLIREQL